MSDEPAHLPPTVHVSWRELAVVLVLVFAPFVLLTYLGGLLDERGLCIPNTGSRRARFAERMLCAAGAGWLGWAYLASFLGPLLLLGTLVRRKLTRSLKLRR